MTVAQAAEIFGRVVDAARPFAVADVEAMIGAHASALTRFANNTIHQNVSEHSRYLSVRIQENGRTARASTNRFDDDSIRSVVADAVSITRASDPQPSLLPLGEPEEIQAAERFSEATARTTPAERAARVAEAIAVVEKAGQTAAGIYSTEASFDSLYNSRGVSAWHSETLARFSITAMAADSSGWAKASAVDRAAIDPVALARSAADKATRSASPRELPAGRYTVILEPAAVLDLVGQIFPDFSSTAVADQRSFLTDRLGKKLFGDNITIIDDVFHPAQAGAPYDGEGVPRRVVNLVDRGTPIDVVRSRASAVRDGKSPTGHGYPLPNEIGEAPLNLVIRGGDSSIQQMISSTVRGILVTRLWYIREVDPYEKIMTGMTRDGTFLVEDGQIVCGVRNFRFNQSVIEMLKQVESLSPAVRSSGEETFDMVAPGMKVNGFQFTEVTRF